MELKEGIVTILDKKLINLSLKACTKEEAITELSNILFENNKLLSKEVFIRDVLERERHCTTGIGSGIAIPHGKSESVKETSVAIGKLSKEIDWQSLDEKPVKLIFLLCVKKQDVKETHLKILSHIATALIDDEVVSKLLKAETSDDIINLLCI